MPQSALLVVAATLAFVLMGACVKVARVELSTFEVMAWRAGAALPLVWLLSRRTGGLVLGNRRLFAVRAGLGFSAMFCFFYAAGGLGLADLSFVGRLEPVFVAVLAPLALGASERAGGRIWLLLAAGLLGCGLIFGPDLRFGDASFAALAVASTLLSAAAHVSIRALSATERATPIVFWFQFCALVAAVLGALLTTGGLPAAPPHLLPVLIGSGVFAGVGQLLMTRAYQMERAAFISAVGYVTPVWALLVDGLVFGLVPPGHALAGGAVILIASAALLRAPRVVAPSSAVDLEEGDPCTSPPVSSSDAPPTPTPTSTRPSA